MSAVLAFDTATDDTAVAVVDGGRVLFDQVRGPRDGRPQHGPALLEMVEQAVATAGGWRSIKRLVVGVGPGSFTGLRVGMATANALARSAGIELVGATTLDSLAVGALSRGPVDGPVLCALDARRGQVFAALYEGDAEVSSGGQPRRLVEPFVAAPTELPAALAERLPAIAVGSGALRFIDQLEADGINVAESDHPAHRISASWTAGLGSNSGQPIEPIYLRPPDAERWRERDKTDRNAS